MCDSDPIIPVYEAVNNGYEMIRFANEIITLIIICVRNFKSMLIELSNFVRPTTIVFVIVCRKWSCTAMPKIDFYSLFLSMRWTLEGIAHECAIEQCLHRRINTYVYVRCAYCLALHNTALHMRMHNLSSDATQWEEDRQRQQQWHRN